MRSSVRASGIAGAALALIALVACGPAPGRTPEAAPSGVADLPTGPLPVEPRWTSCAEATAPPSGAPSADPGLPVPEDANARMLARLDGSFAPVAAVVCDRRAQRRADGGEDMVATESRADDIADLVAALRLPDEAPTTEACTMDLPTVPFFVLLDAQGRWVRPGTPLDSCRKIRIEVRRAVTDLKSTLVSSHPLYELESAGAVAAGCGQSHADMISVEAASGARTEGAPAPKPLRAPIRLCAYRVPPSEQGSVKPAGTFEYGLVLPAERLAGIDAALRSRTPARACTMHASRFALFGSVDGPGEGYYVELDGCQRVMTAPVNGPPTLLQGDAALVALLGPE